MCIHDFGYFDTITTVFLLGFLSIGTTYYWSVQAVDSAFAGSPWAAEQSVTVVAPVGDIHGTKWNDLDADGIRDAGEPGLEGWTIYLDQDSDGVLDAGEPSTVTDADGEYSFIGLPVGDYTVAEVLQAGWEQTYPDEFAVTLTPDVVASIHDSPIDGVGDSFNSMTDLLRQIDPEYAAPADSQEDRAIAEMNLDALVTRDLASANIEFTLAINNSAGDDRQFHVWAYAGNGVAELDDFSDPGILIGDVQLLASPVTFNLDALAAVQSILDSGSGYIGLRFDPIGGYVAPVIVGEVSLDLTERKDAHIVQLAAGQVAGNINFGNVRPAEIHGSKWNDLDADGIHDAGEPGLEGWTLYLDLDEDGQLDPTEPSTVTDANGEYAFTGLAFGTYRVGEVMQADWQQTYPASPAYHTVYAGVPEEIVLDVEELAHSDDDIVIGDYERDGLRVTTTASQSYTFRVYGPSDHMWAGSFGLASAWTPVDVILSRIDGGPFTLASIDLANPFPAIPTWSSLTLTGTRSDESTVTETLSGWEGDFETFALGQMTDVVSVHYREAGEFDEFDQMDNLVVQFSNPTVAEGVDFGNVEIAHEVVGRHVFYNNSAFDGNEPLANAADDGAIATDKQALLPGQTATFTNGTSYYRGVNGIMLDIEGLAGTPTADDFTFRVNSDADPGAWVAGPVPTSITVRQGEGLGGSDRVTVIWADSAIKNQWLEVTVLATANTGLAEEDVFCFGNLAGEATGDAGVGQADLDVLLSSWGQNVVLGDPGDVSCDGYVGQTDLDAVLENWGEHLSLLLAGDWGQGASPPAPALTAVAGQEAVWVYDSGPAQGPSLTVTAAEAATTPVRVTRFERRTFGAVGMPSAERVELPRLDRKGRAESIALVRQRHLARRGGETFVPATVLDVVATASSHRGGLTQGDAAGHGVVPAEVEPTSARRIARRQSAQRAAVRRSGKRVHREPAILDATSPSVAGEWVHDLADILALSAIASR